MLNGGIYETSAQHATRVGQLPSIHRRNPKSNHRRNHNLHGSRHMPEQGFQPSAIEHTKKKQQAHYP